MNQRILLLVPWWAAEPKSGWVKEMTPTKACQKSLPRINCTAPCILGCAQPGDFARNRPGPNPKRSFEHGAHDKTRSIPLRHTPLSATLRRNNEIIQLLLSASLLILTLESLWGRYGTCLLLPYDRDGTSGKHCRDICRVYSPRQLS